jgi:hypothetical protein
VAANSGVLTERGEAGNGGRGQGRLSLHVGSRGIGRRRRPCDLEQAAGMRSRDVERVPESMWSRRPQGTAHERGH